ncbi:MAG: ATP-grasp domain-containing protein [Candidatus Omnitrophica bacterium]|nr:ATP-grasp domain-containing protein [Candidatus Omnitrophota bacterium]MBU1128597.1 ATP-grasp domain-containing protein [Candidatus Omnitrophota bacterium]MBU1656769.1 ATP-grasp domain-containing protein [Candidatus Omnitrophota bacterium]MBU1784724.1 ATP-grasp domain-containing protein [Candidatus Omnitrophota bacterium]MBU1851553.1 ATP-grasp domain-containing protein [Candidatus Omnitrophota bacterium]
MSKVKVGVTGTGSLIGQAIIKSIKNSNRCGDVGVIGFDYFPDTIGSHWVDGNWILPDILRSDVSSEEWLETLINAVSVEELQILFIGLDFELKLFAEKKDIIAERTGCRVVVSDSEIIRIANDKYLTNQFLAENGFDHPKTVLIENMDSSGMEYPCIIKPRVGQRSRGVYIVNEKKELEAKAGEITDPIVQELIGDENKEYTCGVIFFDGEVKGTIALRRDLKEGNTLNAYLDEDAEDIKSYVKDVALALKPFGACNFQLRLDDKGRPSLFEINARYSGTTYMRALFGFNEVEYILRYLLGEKPESFVLKGGKVKRFYDEVFIEDK